MNEDGFYWFSSNSMTFGVFVQEGKIHVTAPIAGTFLGQPLENLIKWMQRQKGFKYGKLSEEASL